MGDEPTKEDEKGETDADKGTPDKAGDAGSSDPPTDKGSGGDRDSLRQMVKEILAEEREAAGASGEARRSQDIEEEAARLVREASARLVQEREAAEKAAKEAEKKAKEKAKEVIEDAPKKLRRVTKLMWGGE